MPYEKTKDLLTDMKVRPYDERVNHFIKEVIALGLPNTKKATRLLLNEMNVANGFQRHDGRDYFVHPIAVAQTALDFEIISMLILNNEKTKADQILTCCLLHDIIEDVPEYSKSRIAAIFGTDIADNVDNLSKRNNEPFENYIERVSSNEVSALVKILDRLNNVATLDNSTLKHRQKQLYETRLVYLPLTKIYRRTYWEYSNFYFQARSIMTSILNVIEHWNRCEDQLNETSNPIN